MLPIDLDNEKPVPIDEKQLLEDQKKKNKADMDLFRVILPSLMETGKDVIQGDDEKANQYKRYMFMINRAMSHHIDCLGIAVGMNLYSAIPPKSHHQIYLNNIRKYKRGFVKWKGEDSEMKNVAKREKKIEIIAEYHGYSPRIAREIVDLYSDDRIDIMQEQMEKGG